jgi:hypothetical protein
LFGVLTKYEDNTPAVIAIAIFTLFPPFTLKVILVGD